MPQTSNKLSSFIGIILLIGIIGFTVFINFFVDKPKNTISESDNITTETNQSIEINTKDLWELESIEAYAGRVIEKERKYHMRIYKRITRDSTHNYGTILFKTDFRKNKTEPLLFNKLDIDFLKNKKDSVFLNKIGNIFLKYQIKFINTDYQYGNFTAIHLKDGRVIFLIAQNLEVIDKYYKDLIEQSVSINDSTKIAYPETVRRVNNQN